MSSSNDTPVSDKRNRIISIICMCIAFYLLYWSVTTVEGFDADVQKKIENRESGIFPSSGSMKSSRQVLGRDPAKSVKNPRCKYVLGWSTGFCGTTTLSNKKAYANADHVLFEHEYTSRIPELKIRTKWCQPSEHSRWFNTDATMEIAKKLVNAWNERLAKENRTIFVDLGHHLVCGYFVEALSALLGGELCLVRIRRARLVQALSLSQGEAGAAGPCKGDRMWPFCAGPGAVLYERIRDVWDSLSVYQRWLWSLDEAEARWHRIRSHTGKLVYTEVNWIDELDTQRVQRVAHLFGAQAVEQVPRRRGHTPKDVRDATDFAELDREDQAYKELVDYNATEQMWLNPVQF